MNQALNTLRTVQWGMLASIFLYGIVGELAGPPARGVDPTVSYIFTTLGVAIVGAIFVVRRTLVHPAAASLASQPDNPLSLTHWRTGYLVTYVLCESVALFGLVLRFMGGNLRLSFPYYLGGFALLLFFRPQPPQREFST